MKNSLRSLAASAVIAIVVLNACQALKKPLSSEEKIARGKYLVDIAGCNDCHTPLSLGPKGPEPDLTHYLAGHKMGPLPKAKLDEKAPWVWAGTGLTTAFSGPWGTTYAINLTPDEQTGIGIWTEGMFFKAMREGKHMGQSRPIMPPMPWVNLSKMTDEDLSSVFAYLKSLPPVSNEVPDYEPPTPSK